MICATSRLNANPSCDRTVMLDNFWSNLCDSVRFAQLSTMLVELVPTTNIVLNWANRTESHKFDQKLSSITVRSHDGFAFNLDVAQIIHVGALDAPKVISRVGSMQNLVDHVLQPIVGNYFRNSAQAYTVLDFLCGRTARQEEAAGFIHAALSAYDVQAVDTLIG